MPTPALDAVDVSWAGGTVVSASPLLDGVSVSWFVPSESVAITIEPASIRLTVSRAVLIETAQQELLRVFPTPTRLSYGAHEVTQESLDSLLRIRTRSGPRMSAGRPAVSFLLPQQIRGVGGVRLGYAQPTLNMTIAAGSAALSLGAVRFGLMLGPPASVALTAGSGHELALGVRAWPANVLRVGVPYITKGSPHP